MPATLPGAQVTNPAPLPGAVPPPTPTGDTIDFKVAAQITFEIGKTDPVAAAAYWLWVRLVNHQKV